MMAAKAAVDREKTVAITNFDSAPWGRNAKTSAPRAQQARTAVVGMRGTRGSRNLPASQPCNPPELEPTNPTTLVPCVANQAAKPRMLKYGLSVAEIREERRLEYARLGNTGLMVSELCLGT